jgi:hypothetical protein
MPRRTFGVTPRPRRPTVEAAHGRADRRTRHADRGHHRQPWRVPALKHASIPSGVGRILRGLTVDTSGLAEGDLVGTEREAVRGQADTGRHIATTHVHGGTHDELRSQVAVVGQDLLGRPLEVGQLLVGRAPTGVRVPEAAPVVRLDRPPVGIGEEVEDGEARQHQQVGDALAGERAERRLRRDLTSGGHTEQQHQQSPGAR